MKSVRTDSTNKAFATSREEFRKDVITGLSKSPKSLPSKYFYDQAGSHLFEKICALEEYYLTRVELALLTSIREELAAAIGRKAAIIEPGAGAGIKIQILLNALEAPALYAPLDISEEFLLKSAKTVQRRFPKLNILPLIGDFTRSMSWPNPQIVDRRIVFFPGSTLGNFEAAEALSFLKNIRALMGKKGALILGVDMVKKIEVLHAAYNDCEGVTEAFNKNLLLRINRELGGNFDPDAFSHVAFFNEPASRIEMHLESRVDQQVTIAGQRFELARNERIHTENSHKFTLESIHDLTERAGLRCARHWLDERRYFSIHFLEPAAS